MDNRKDYSKYTVLIVDDIPVNIILLKTMLARTNVKILTAVNGQEALDLVRSLKPQVVLESGRIRIHQKAGHNGHSAFKCHSST